MIITVAIVDKDKHYGASLKKIIDTSTDLACVGLFTSLQESLTGLAISTPDVVLVQASLLQAQRTDYFSIITSITPHSSIILIHEEKNIRLLKTKATADGFLYKNEQEENVVRHIQGIYQTSKGSEPVSKGLRKNQQHQDRISLGVLTSREKEILHLLSEGLFYKEIAKKEKITIDTVKKHCTTIYKKLHVQNRTEAVNFYAISK
jgi:two-component system, NarL family, response regulator LiaR